MKMKLAFGLNRLPDFSLNVLTAFSVNFLTAFSLVSLSAFGLAHAQGMSSQGSQKNEETSSEKSVTKTQAFEALCRVKAKESANLAFRSCMGESKGAEIEKIRQEYQDKLSKMKSAYESDLSRVSGKKNATVSGPSSKASLDKKKSSGERVLIPNAILEDNDDSSDSAADGLVDTENDPSEAISEELKDSESETTERTSKPARSLKDTLIQTQQVPSKVIPVKVRVQSRATQLAASGRAILFDEYTDIPEPIPVEKLMPTSRR